MCVMKLNKYFMMGAMGLSLVACSDNLDDNGQSANGTNPNEGTTYAAFTIDFKGTQSRADATHSGTENERKVNKAFVILVDAEGNIETVLEKTEDAKTTEETGEGVYTVGETERYLFQTTAGDHTFYAVINPDTEPDEDTDIEQYFTNAVAMSVEGDNAIADPDATGKGFMMTCQKAENFYVNPDVTQEEALAASDAKNNYTIDVERVAAKVTVVAENVELTDKTGNNADGKITNTTFSLYGGATHTTRMAQAAAELTGNVWSYSKTNVNVCTSKGDKDNIYDNATPVYCLENLHTDAAHYDRNNTTYITITTSFIPKKVIDTSWDGTDEDEYLKDNPNYATDTPASFYVVTEGTLAGNYILKEDYDAATGGVNGVDAKSEEYVNGKSSWGPIWLAQNVTADNAIAPVYRNTWYNLQITGISLPGQPKEPVIDDDDDNPLVQDTNVAILLNVLAWNFESITVDLK